MNLTLSSFLIDNKVAFVQLSDDKTVEVCIGGETFNDPDVLLEKVPSLLDAANSLSAAYLLTSLYVGFDFKVISKRQFPATLHELPQITNQIFTWTLQERRSHLFYVASLPIEGRKRTFCITLKEEKPA